MTKVKIVGKIRAITYSCTNMNGTIGLCKKDNGGSLYRHEFKENPPLLAITPEGGMAVLCKVAFSDGFISQGIGDYGGTDQQCDMYVLPPKQLSPLGDMVNIEIVGSPDVIKVEDAILAVSKNHRRLYVIPKDDWHRYSGGPPVSVRESLDTLSSGVAENPQIDLSSLDPDVKELLKFNADGALSNIIAVEDHLNSQEPGTNTKASWCITKHGRYVAADHHMKEFCEHASSAKLPEMTKKMREFKDNWLKALENPQIGDIRDLRNRFRSDFKDFLPSGCSDGSGVCAHDRSPGAASPIGHPHPPEGPEPKSPHRPPWAKENGVVIIGASGCPHCAALKETLENIGTEYDFVDLDSDTKANAYARHAGVNSIPKIEVWKNGRVVRENVGEMDDDEATEFIER